MAHLRLRGHALWRSSAAAGDSPIKVPVAGKSSVQVAGKSLKSVSPLGNEIADSTKPVWISGDFEVRDGHIYQVPATATPDVEGWILPGLVDVHCHIGIKMGGFASPQEMLQQARINHAAGVLLARDCGSPNDNSYVANRSDTLRLVRAGRHLAKPKRYIKGSALELVSDAELPEAMRVQCLAGDGWVKLVGDWIDRAKGAESDLQPLWDSFALAEGVAAVHELGGRVTVHTFAHRTVDSLLAAGVDCIEHGTGMDNSQITEAARQGIAITPTLLQVWLFDQFADAAGSKYPVYAAHMRRLLREHERVLERFVDAGVRLLPGTDAGGFQPHGRLPQELWEWQRMGFSAAEIIDLASWRARDYLGFHSLSEGAVADFVVYDADPTQDLTVLQRPKYVHLGVR